jgi:hypothetical protein
MPKSAIEITSRPAFTDANARDYAVWVNRESHTNKTVLDATKRMAMRHWLTNLDDRPSSGTPKERQAQYNLRNFALNHFELQRGQVYRSAEKHLRKGKSVELGPRLAICKWDSTPGAS